MAPIAAARFAAAVRLRRTLHQHPELAFSEVRTGERIAQALKKAGCRVTTGLGRTGLIADLEGASARGPVVALRSDMDALPVTEKTGLPFASKNPGVMHACGHDTHMATVVSVAEVLARLRKHWHGTVRFLFQPSEEVPPGGAIEMIADGALKNPPVEIIFGLHVDPWIPVGKLGLKDGVMMARTDDFDLTIFGKGGHGARPHLGRDAVYIASQVVTALQSIVSRTVDPLSPAVLSIGRITGGVARNVLADDVRLEGTVRTLDPQVAAGIEQRLATVARGVARALGGSARLEYRRGYPVLVNDPAVNDDFRAAARAVSGRHAVVELSAPMMGGEDFAHYLNAVPGAMMRLGIRNPKIGAVHAWHHPKFTVDEAAIEIGCRILCGAILGRLKTGALASAGRGSRRA